MKRHASALVAVSAVVLLMGQAAYQWATQVGCTSEVITCSSGSCSRAVPDGGSDAGISLDSVRSFTVKVCGTSARPLAGAGTLKDYHCSGGKCPEVTYNSLTVSATGACQEFPPFVIPAALPATDTMVWAASAVTITNWDGGTADTITTTICPAQ